MVIVIILIIQSHLDHQFLFHFYVTSPIRFLRIFKDIPNFNIVHTSVLAIKTVYLNLKCKGEVTSFSNVVYSLTCTKCNKVCIVQISQILKKQSLYKSDGKLHPGRCALAKYTHNLDHIIDHSLKKSNISKKISQKYLIFSKNLSDMKHLGEIYSCLLSMDFNDTIKQ